LTCCALDDAEEARELVRSHVCFYIGGMGTFYRDSLARQGYEDVAEEIFEKWQQGEKEAAKSALPDSLLDEIAVAGSPEDARAQFEKFRDIEGIEAVSVSFPRAANLEQIKRTVRELAP
jgi:alkanesulfonate monooxygenase SsuD/methylene tetrahydromethanopterin reductase-like flavin-dependent oxidoreductase (luciferase family)